MKGELREIRKIIDGLVNKTRQKSKKIGKKRDGTE